MSDFPPPATSAINLSKNRKKKNKKKNNKKQEDVVPSPPVEGVSYADAAAMPAEDESVNSDDTSAATSDAINDTTDSRTNDQSHDDKHSAAPNLNTIPTTGAPSFAEIAATSPSPSNDVDTHPEVLSELVKYSIQSVIASRCIHIDEIVAEISKKVKAGEYNTSVPVVSHKRNPPSAAISDPLPLSDAINSCINSAVVSGSMDLYSIVDRIAYEVKEGNYNTSSTPITTTATTDKPKPTSSESAGSPSSFQLTEPVQASIDSAIASRSIHLYAIVEDISKKVQNGEYNTKAHEEHHHRKSLKEVVAESTGVAESTIAAVTSAVAGTAAAISERFSSVHPEKLSENVEHCIQSTINARSINLEGILHHSKDKLKRPEAAVGETMPSSAKKADTVPPTPSKVVGDVQAKQPTVPKKDTHLETHKPKTSDHHQQQQQQQHKKKKDCIIL